MSVREVADIGSINGSSVDRLPGTGGAIPGGDDILVDRFLSNVVRSGSDGVVSSFSVRGLSSTFATGGGGGTARAGAVSN